MVLPSAPAMLGSGVRCFMPRPHLLRAPFAAQSLGAFHVFMGAGLGLLVVAEHSCLSFMHRRQNSKTNSACEVHGEN